MSNANDARLRHMLDAAMDAVGFCSAKSRAALDEDRLLALALVKCIEIVGEAAAHVPAALRDRPGMRWLPCGIG